jgi:hypothetical protein
VQGAAEAVQKENPLPSWLVKACEEKVKDHLKE